MNLRPILADSLMITGFVFVMMLLVEYAQVATAGVLGRWLQRGGVFRTAAVALVGTTPGCLGAFTDVTLYTHGLISFGAIAGAMIAASGDCSRSTANGMNPCSRALRASRRSIVDLPEPGGPNTHK